MRIININLCKFLLPIFMLASTYCYAGAQKEEMLSNAVRTALAKTVSESDGYLDTSKLFEADSEKIKYKAWRKKIEKRLERRINIELIRQDLIDSIYYEAKRAGLEPELVLGLIQVESGFKKYAISSVSARGLMQVMPFWTRNIGNGDVSALFNPQVNLRYGCTILRHYLDIEKGNLYLALGRYNGSRGQPQYPNAVRAAWNAWKKTVTVNE
jgi:soluble lytic murein transglycosylase-like protein